MSRLPPLNNPGQGRKFTDFEDLDVQDSAGNEDSNSDHYKTNFLFDNYKPRNFTDEEINECFNSFDLSKTGFLSSAEIKRCFVALGANVTDEEVDEMLKMCDTVMLIYLVLFTFIIL